MVTTTTSASAWSTPKRMARAGPRPSELSVGRTRGSCLAYFSGYRPGGAENLSGLELQARLELVAEARACVIGFRLEGHPQDPDGHAAQVVDPLDTGDDVVRETLVYHHRGVPESEVVVVEGRK